jgi:hypothetical protein
VAPFNRTFSSLTFVVQLHVPMASTTRRPSVISKSDGHAGDGILTSEHVQVTSRLSVFAAGF